MGEKNARKNFSKNTRIGYPKNVGKKSSQKSAKKCFLKTHLYCDEKCGEKKREKIFTRNTRISRAKNDGKKVWKKRENTFFL